MSLRVGTRGSALALAQARAVVHALTEPAELVTITTAGDVDRARGDKSRWVGALESALRARGADVVAQVLAENDGRWEALTERDRQRVEALARAIANRLLHEPTQRVKELDPEHRHARLSLLRELFGLDEAPAVESADDAEVRHIG